MGNLPAEQVSQFDDVVEQLLLQGIPAILVDRKGDLARYADPDAWASPADPVEAAVVSICTFQAGSAEPSANRTAIVEFQVDDVDAEFARLKDEIEVVHAPKMMPWGNRALLFRDPDGNLVNLFTPVTDEARAKFGTRAEDR